MGDEALSDFLLRRGALSREVAQAATVGAGMSGDGSNSQ
jgi:hypothetical protein